MNLNIVYNTRRPQMPRSIRAVLEKKPLALIDEGVWNQYNMQKIVRGIKSWKVRVLGIGTWIKNSEYNKQPQILKQIQNICFSRLECLEVGGNTIESIQVINKIHLPELKECNLYDNHLTSIRTLRKLNARQIRTLRFNSNSIADFPVLACLMSGCLNQVEVELWEDSVEQGEDIRWWAKLPICSSDFSAQTLCVRRRNRIPQHSFTSNFNKSIFRVYEMSAQ